MASAPVSALSPPLPPGAALPNFLIYEYNQLFNPLRHSVMHEAINFHAGVLIPNAGAGLGLSLNDVTIERYRAD